jgi:hypothetical protein
MIPFPNLPSQNSKNRLHKYYLIYRWIFKGRITYRINIGGFIGYTQGLGL